jgi:hypothetical protein
MPGLSDLGLSTRGTLVINPGGVSAPTLATNLRTAAWWVLDYMPLTGTANERGDNVPIGGANGTRAYPRIRHETTYSLNMLIVGTHDRSGTPSADPLSGLWLNIDDLRANVCGQYDMTTATRSATFTLPNATALTASVQCALHIGEVNGRSRIRAVFDVTIPAGRFV